MRALRRTLGAINESVLAIDEQIDRVDPTGPGGCALREQVFALELAVEEVAAAVVPTTARDRTTREAIAAALLAVRQAVRAREEAAVRLAIAAVDRLARSDGRDVELLAQIGALLRSLLAALRPDVRLAPGPERITGPTEPGATTPRPTWRWSLRLAAQATLAAGLALAAGHAAASSRAYWAVMASFMVFSRANTRGAVLVRAWQRLVGTLVGVIVGLLVAQAVQGHVYLELVVLFGCMFIAYYTLQFAYAFMVAAFTTAIAVLYSLLGMFSTELLYLRVLETLVGVGVGGAVAMLVFPVSTRATIRAHMVEALHLLAGDLEAAFAVPGPDRPTRREAARARDRKLRDVRSEVQGAAGGVPLRSTRETAQLFFAFAAVFFHARPLLMLDPRALDDAAIARAHADATHLASRARALADRLAGASQLPLPVALPPAEVAADPAQRGLRRLDRALSTLARVLGETRAPRRGRPRPIDR
nr:FUSC family protein [Nannocystis sp. SCPEA4]